MRLTKKFFYLIALLAMVTFTSCTDPKEDVNKYTFADVVNNRVVNGNQVAFSQGTIQVELDLTAMTIQFNTDYLDTNGTKRTVNTSAMKMTPRNGVVYQFSDMNVTGFIDLSTGMMRYVIGEDVTATTNFRLSYLTTTVTNEDTGGTYSHEQTGYIFTIDDSKGETATMQVANFVPDTNGTIQASMLQYRGLKVVPTTSGYTITADAAQCYQGDYYNLKDLNVNITDGCMRVDGSFKIKNHTYKMTGNVFGANN